MPSTTSNLRPLLPYVLTSVPPLIMAVLNPDAFFAALDIAGTYGVLVLFGILPALMAWSERYGLGGEAERRRGGERGIGKEEEDELDEEK